MGLYGPADSQNNLYIFSRFSWRGDACDTQASLFLFGLAESHSVPQPAERRRSPISLPQLSTWENWSHGPVFPLSIWREGGTEVDPHNTAIGQESPDRRRSPRR